jgi:death on curing protein
VIVWLTVAAVLAIHDEQMVEHGGQEGVLDFSRLEAALARPQNLFAYYDPEPDMATLAACYAHGIANKHGFVDGNKRTSLVATETFLGLNGLRLTATNIEVVGVWTDLGSGRMEETELAEWLRQRLEKASP